MYMAPVLSIDSTYVFLGHPHPKSISYTRNLGHPATVTTRSFANEARLGIQFFAPFNTPSRNPSTAPPIASDAAANPSFPAKSLPDALAPLPEIQFPKNTSGIGGSRLFRQSIAKEK
ncbi:hypothetical protein AAC387_Pa11g2226 [Persea americana]